MMDAARQVGLPMLEQVYFADYFYPLCGTPRSSLQWRDGFDPSPKDSHDVKPEEFVQFRGTSHTVEITYPQHLELVRRRDYYLARGGKLFSLELAAIEHNIADEYNSPCTAQELLHSNFKTALECRADALRKLADEIGARADLYVSDFTKLWMVLSRAVSMGGSGAGVGTVVGGSIGGVLAPAGAVIGGAVGAAGGATVGIYLAESIDAKVEGRPVKNFLQRTVECSKLAKLEVHSKREAETPTSANINQIMVVTKQYGIFALYPFTLKRGPTLLGDYVIEEHGANPTEYVRERFGR